MQTLLLTLNSPTESVDLELPAEVPVESLLPALVRMNTPERGLQPDSPLWGLWSAATHQRLDPGRSLLEAGVVDGEILYLQYGSAPVKLPSKQEVAFQPKAIRPSVNSGGIGVRWRNPQ